MKILSKVFIISLFLLSTFYFLSSATSAHAASPTITPTQTKSATVAANANPDVPNNLHNWTQSVMIEVMSALTCQIAGVDPINPKQSCLGADQKTGKIGFLPSPQTGGAIGFMGNMISTLYTPPLHTSDYFKDLASNFGLSKHAYAQTTGTGFKSLTPLIGIWSAFRNIVYLILVIIFVVIGLAIMLRVKIDPRTVMTIQNQIPKIIIGILAVTFSFAIAGFLIDMMWVFIYLIFGVISGISPEIAKSVAGLNPSTLQNTSVIGGAVGIGDINSIAGHVATNGSDILKKMLGIGPTFTQLNPGNITNFPSAMNFLNSLGSMFGFVPNADALSWLINTASLGVGLFFGDKVLNLPVVIAAGNSLGILTNLPAAIFATVGGYAGTNALLREALPFLIVYVIVFIAILMALFRLWFVLIMSYVQILLAIVLAPFWIIGGIIPGSPISLSGWLKDIGANLLAFPATIAMFMLGRVFMDSFGRTPPLGQSFVPPLIGNPGDPSLIGSLIALGIILMTPNVVNMLKQMLKAPKTDLGGVLKGIGAGAALPTKAIQSGAGLYGAATYDISGKKDSAGRGGRIFQKLFSR